MRVLAYVNALLLLMIIFLGGCSPAALTTHETPREIVDPESSLSTESPEQKTRQKVERFLAEDNLVQAGQELLTARRQGVAEKAQADLYSTLENRLLQEAGQAGQIRHYAQAGRLYRMALSLYPEAPEVSSTIVMTRAEINGHLEWCADELMKSGLEAYRAGELLDAVKTWKEIAEFYPEHSPSEVAITTAEQQLETLEKIAPDKEM